MSCRQQGFGLVEVMIGLVMGLLSVIIVMQVFAVSEASKRTTTGGADATTNGAAALYLIEREAKMAGWGLDASLYLGRPDKNGIASGCVTLNAYCNPKANCDWKKELSLAPLTITDGANGGPDALTMRFYADPDNGNYISAAASSVSSNKLAGTGNIPQLKVGSVYGCSKGDLVLVGDPTDATGICTLIQVSDAPGTTTGNLYLPHKSGNLPEQIYNDPAWEVEPIAGKPPIVAEGKTRATCFKPAPKGGPSIQRSYTIDTKKGALVRSDTGEVIADGIVDLQAQYGVANDGAQHVTASGWVDAVGPNWDKPVPKAGTAGSTTDNRLQNIKAVRVAILTRSAQFEKPASGSTCDATTGSPGTPGPNGWSTWATFNTAKYPDRWNCYRYKAFEIILPVRNVIWGSS